MSQQVRSAPLPFLHLLCTCRAPPSRALYLDYTARLSRARGQADHVAKSSAAVLLERPARGGSLRAPTANLTEPTMVALGTVDAPFVVYNSLAWTVVTVRFFSSLAVTCDR